MLRNIQAMSEIKPLLTGILPHLAAPTSFLLLFTLPPFGLRRLAYLAVFTTFFSLCFLQFTVLSAWPQLQLALSVTWMYYLGWLTKMLFHRPEHDFWRIGRPAHEAEKMSFGLKKLSWAFALLSAPRGVGWNYQIANLRPRTKLVGRWWFAARQTVRVIILSIVSLFSGAILMRWHRELNGFWKATLVPMIGIKCWSDAETQYALCNAILVAIGLAEEKDCFPLFGNNLTRLDSLQEFWGQFWHQNFRTLFQDCGHAVCRLLRIRRHTQLYWTAQVWTAFLISGAVHALAMSIEPGMSSTYTRFRALVVFFLLQAVGLTLEGLFLDTPVKDLTLYEVGLEDEMLMGRIWTFGWLLFSGYWSLESWVGANWSLLSIFVLLTPALKRSGLQARS
ncbi:membrane bound O-acyl transferase family-domain-containing protein [Echria macrotheca]|uniref:Membrane bound O-acyl transferase family-domain-containing protein n=1 Tax=Echria macrotheca TaxID=438768 RepID=A0AAJ0BLV3_9PEZI|nr:membrane bound O-acyl transferase family-domain-containing protein [Echria macrotheca]